MIGSNKLLIEHLKNNKLITSKVVEKAMLKVDRANFVGKNNLSEAYQDHPLSIGLSQTISAPHMHAIALSALELQATKNAARILDVGAGSGYLTACFGRMIEKDPKAIVVGIEVLQSLVDLALKNIKADSPDLLESGQIVLKKGDGWKGEKDLGPFDAIHVGAAAETLPDELVNQLAFGGRMIIPLGKSNQALYQIDKDEHGKVSKKELMGVRYVPLVKDL